MFHRVNGSKKIISIYYYTRSRLRDRFSYEGAGTLLVWIKFTFIIMKVVTFFSRKVAKSYFQFLCFFLGFLKTYLINSSIFITFHIYKKWWTTTPSELRKTALVVLFKYIFSIQKKNISITRNESFKQTQWEDP